MTVHADAAGPAIYAGGPDQVPAPGIVQRWDGTSWTSIGPMPFATTAASLLSQDDGSGQKLYAGVAPLVNGAPAVFRFDGTAWQPVGGGAGSTTSALTGIVRCLSLFDDGSGLRLYAANQSVTTAMQVARWDGAGWSSVAAVSGNGPLVFRRLAAIGTLDGDLHLGGLFDAVDSLPSVNIAKGRLRRPRVLLGQIGGPGNGVTVWNENLVPNRAYQNVFSIEPCPSGPGGGPWLGLCSSDPAILFFQIGLPLGTVPFHFTSPISWTVAGPYPLSPGLVIEGLCFDRTYNVLGCVGPVTRYTVQ
jgi:hypothetical protein